MDGESDVAHPDFNSRYIALKAIASEHINSEIFNENQVPILPTTATLIETIGKDPVSLINIYCSVTESPQYQFFIYEFPGGGR